MAASPCSGSSSGSKSGCGRKVSFKNETEIHIYDDADSGCVEQVGPAKNVVNIEGILRMPRRGKLIIDPPIVNDTPSEPISTEEVKHDTYAGKLNSGNPPKFRFLESVEKLNGVDVVLPRKSVAIVQERLAFTLYGYFVGERLAYPVVEYFVRSHWKKFGLQKVMMNANGFFFFKFSDNKGMFDVLEGGPWLIRNKPIFLNKWSPTQNLAKKEIQKAAVWVKFHDVPLAAYTEDGLSMLASKIGIPKLLDTYTTSMCSDLWGRSSYARALIEISAEHEFQDVLSIAIPDMEGVGFVTEKITIEYEWQPPRCAQCCIFGHVTTACPKQTVPEPIVPPKKVENIPKSTKYQPKVADNDGFTEVKHRKTAKKSGVPVKNQKSKIAFQPLNYQKMVGGAASSSAKMKEKVISNPKSHNPFAVLNGTVNEDGSDREADEEYDDFMIPPVHQGASTSNYASYG